MDFVSVGQSILREGQMVYLKLHAVYQYLSQMNLQVPDQDLHEDLLAFDEEAWLEAFYVLGHTEKTVTLAVLSDELTILELPLIVKHDRKQMCVLDVVYPPVPPIDKLNRVGTICDKFPVLVSSSRVL